MNDVIETKGVFLVVNIKSCMSIMITHGCTTLVKQYL